METLHKDRKNGFPIQINTDVQESKKYLVYLRNYFTFKLNFLKLLVCQRKQSRQNKFLSVRLLNPRDFLPTTKTASGYNLSEETPLLYI